MADYDNGLSPATRSEGEISTISLDKTIYREEDAKRSITSITLDKSNISEDLDESHNIVSISLEKTSAPALSSWKIESICVEKLNIGICLGGFF